MHMLETHIVPHHVSRQRLSDYLCGVFSALPSRKGVKKAILRGAIQVDGEPGQTGQWIEPGQRIELLDIPRKSGRVFTLKLEVIFEDDYLAVINKPAGFPVSGNQFKTIENALPHNLTPSTLPDRLHWPTPVHRLDSLTSGLLLIGKTRQAQIEMSAQFEQNTIIKTYQAIVIGTLPEAGVIQDPVDEKPALTHFQRLKVVPSLESDTLSLVELQPKTGRTHQLRIHLARLGYPIQGDKLYAGNIRLLKGKGLFLCATGLAFKHPQSKEPLSYSIQPPNKFSLLLKRSEKRWHQFNHVR